MNNLPCSSVSHAAITVDHRAFSIGAFIGYQAITGDVIELRRCVLCSATLSRPLDIGARLDRARSANGGNGDQDMIARCKRAMTADPGAVRSYIETVEFEALMPRVKTDLLPDGWVPQAEAVAVLEDPAPSAAMRDEVLARSLVETQRLRVLR